MSEDQPPPVKEKTLLEKYEIPIAHLDFEYVRGCTNASEIEKIYRILVSQEEGFFPDLTTCTEERLKQLKPNSKLLRREEPLLQRCMLKKDDQSTYNVEMQNWITSMKQRDGKLRKISKTDEEKSNYQANLPPVRKVQETKKDSKPESEATGKKSDRIKSHEYDKWDKYDAEAEELKLDLEEEKNREMVDLMNKKNLEKSKIEELFEPNLATFTDVEKEVLAKRYKETGNDFYNAGDYSEAVKEYNKSIRVLPTATTYNNRAIAYIKMNKFVKALGDCENCLKLEPTNIKAMLRKAQALIGYDKRRNAYDVYLQVLRIDPTNILALKGTEDLRAQLPNLPPPDAVRMKIVDHDNITEEENTELPPPLLKTEPKYLDFDKGVDAQNIHKNRWLIEEEGPKNEFAKAFNSFANKNIKKPERDIKISSDVIAAPAKKKGALIQEIK